MHCGAVSISAKADRNSCRLEKCARKAKILTQPSACVCMYVCKAFVVSAHLQLSACCILRHTHIHKRARERKSICHTAERSDTKPATWGHNEEDEEDEEEEEYLHSTMPQSARQPTTMGAHKWTHFVALAAHPRICGLL